MYCKENFCDCADDSVCGANVLKVVVLLLKMMNRVFQFRTMEPTNIFILSPCRSDALLPMPQGVSHFSDHIHLSLNYDENIGNGIIFSIDVTWTYYMTEFCVFDSFSVIVWKMLMEQDDLFQYLTPTSPPCLARFSMTNNIIGRIYSGISRGGSRGVVLTPLSRTILTKNRPKLWKHRYLPKFKPKKKWLISYL